MSSDFLAIKTRLPKPRTKRRYDGKQVLAFAALLAISSPQAWSMDPNVVGNPTGSQRDLQQHQLNRDAQFKGAPYPNSQVDTSMGGKNSSSGGGGGGGGGGGPNYGGGGGQGGGGSKHQSPVSELSQTAKNYKLKKDTSSPGTQLHKSWSQFGGQNETIGMGGGGDKTDSKHVNQTRSQGWGGDKFAASGNSSNTPNLVDTMHVNQTRSQGWGGEVPPNLVDTPHASTHMDKGSGGSFPDLFAAGGSGVAGFVFGQSKTNDVGPSLGNSNKGYFGANKSWASPTPDQRLAAPGPNGQFGIGMVSIGQSSSIDMGNLLPGNPGSKGGSPNNRDNPESVYKKTLTPTLGTPGGAFDNNPRPRTPFDPRNPISVVPTNNGSPNDGFNPNPNRPRPGDDFTPRPGDAFDNTFPLPTNTNPTSPNGPSNGGGPKNGATGGSPNTSTPTTSGADTISFPHSEPHPSAAGQGKFPKTDGIQDFVKAMNADKPPIADHMVGGAQAAAASGAAAVMGNKMKDTPGANAGQSKSNQNSQKQQGADNLAAMERYHAAAAIDWVRSFLENFTTDGGNKWNQIRDRLFVPMAILLLLPGAVIAQLKSIVSQGFVVLGEINPFDGIFRSIVGIFLIPATYLVVNYGIDVANSLTLTVAQTYRQLFGTDMYTDAFCGHIRAFPIREPEENPGMITNQEAQMFNYFGNTPLARLEGKTLSVKYADPCVGLYIVPPDRNNDNVPYMVNEQRLAYNQANAAFTMAWVILCAVQQAYLYYLWLVGPVIAACWVYPSRQLREAFPSWIEGVVTLCCWSLFWSVTILLMACFHGVDDTGTIMFTALNFLAIGSAKFAFDFTGLVKDAGREAMSMAQKAAAAAAKGGGKGGGGGGGSGGKGGGSPQGGEGAKPGGGGEQAPSSPTVASSNTGSERMGSESPDVSSPVASNNDTGGDRSITPSSSSHHNSSSHVAANHHTGTVHPQNVAPPPGTHTQAPQNDMLAMNKGLNAEMPVPEGDDVDATMNFDIDHNNDVAANPGDVKPGEQGVQSVSPNGVVAPPPSQMANAGNADQAKQAQQALQDQQKQQALAQMQDQKGDKLAQQDSQNAANKAAAQDLANQQAKDKIDQQIASMNPSVNAPGMNGMQAQNGLNPNGPDPNASMAKLGPDPNAAPQPLPNANSPADPQYVARNSVSGDDSGIKGLNGPPDTSVASNGPVAADPNATQSYMNDAMARASNNVNIDPNSLTYTPQGFTGSASADINVNASGSYDSNTFTPGSSFARDSVDYSSIPGGNADIPTIEYDAGYSSDGYASYGSDSYAGMDYSGTSYSSTGSDNNLYYQSGSIDPAAIDYVNSNSSSMDAQAQQQAQYQAQAQFQEQGMYREQMDAQQSAQAQAAALSAGAQLNNPQAEQYYQQAVEQQSKQREAEQQAYRQLEEQRQKEIREQVQQQRPREAGVYGAGAASILGAIRGQSPTQSGAGNQIYGRSSMGGQKGQAPRKLLSKTPSKNPGGQQQGQRQSTPLGQRPQTGGPRQDGVTEHSKREAAADWTSGLSIANLKRRAKSIQKQSEEEKQAQLEALKKQQQQNDQQ